MDKINLVKRVKDLSVSPRFQNYSKVIIHIDDKTVIEVGDDTGRTLEYTDPFGSESQARKQLAALNGYLYQPYEANGAQLNPAAEIGDGISVKNVYGGLYNRSRTFGRLMVANISAPSDKEIDHEYEYKSEKDRKYERQIGDVSARLVIQNNMIEAEVTARENADSALSSSITQTANSITASVVAKKGGSQSGFGWTMTDNSHTWYANNKEVMKVSSGGLTVKGVIEATSGKIGGFTIGASAIYNNIASMTATQTSGVYLGTNGIRLGDKFKVDTNGNATASSLVVDRLNIGGKWVSAKELNDHANNAYSWTNENGAYCYGGASGGYSYNNAAQRDSAKYPSSFTCGTLYHKGQFMQFNGYACQLIHVTINNRSYSFIGRYG